MKLLIVLIGLTLVTRSLTISIGHAAEYTRVTSSDELPSVDEPNSPDEEIEELGGAENGFLTFTYKAQFTLPLNLIKSSNSAQFSWANKQLLAKVNSDFSFRAKFTQAQVNQLKAGFTPSGFTWPHHQTRGVLQLVDSSIHSQTGNTGGKAI